MIEKLAQKQLLAYNQNDLDAFCACYHHQVQVLDDTHQILCQGIDQFRLRYQDLFTKFSCGATVSNRMVLARHCVDLETWWRIEKKTQTHTQGDVLVYYQELDQLIYKVQFFKP